MIKRSESKGSKVTRRATRDSAALRIIYASTSGHTEYAIQVLTEHLKKAPRLKVEVQRAEQAQEKDLKKGDILLLASSTWNTGGTEGQLNPHMQMLLRKRAKAVDLQGKPVAVIGCGDERYFYTCRAADHLEEFVESHGGEHLASTLRLINETYGQEKRIQSWGEELLSAIRSLK